MEETHNTPTHPKIRLLSWLQTDPQMKWLSAAHGSWKVKNQLNLSWGEFEQEPRAGGYNMLGGGIISVAIDGAPAVNTNRKIDPSFYTSLLVNIPRFSVVGRWRTVCCWRAYFCQASCPSAASLIEKQLRNLKIWSIIQKSTADLLMYGNVRHLSNGQPSLLWDWVFFPTQVMSALSEILHGFPQKQISHDNSSISTWCTNAG